MSDKLTYKDAGVDVHEGARAVELMKEKVKGTFNANVIGDLGSFGGLFALNENMKEPVLVSGTDGVGTKLKIAFLMDKHDTVGIDLVAMCVNDILCQGAKPLFFLDYIATGKLEAEKAAQLVGGVADGCKMSGMALLGGETAEMPGFYQEGEYDMAGFAVGVVDREKIVTGQNIEAGDVLIGLPSSGIHSNGYSLVRKLFFDRLNMKVTDDIDGLGSLGEALIEPTKIYVKPVLSVLDEVAVKGMVHMTGGGFYENIPRVLPEGLGVQIDQSAWELPKVFRAIMDLGNVDLEEMFATFNMGIGFILVVKEADVEKTLSLLADENPCIMGKVTSDEGVKL